MHLKTQVEWGAGFPIGITSLFRTNGGRFSLTAFRGAVLTGIAMCCFAASFPMRAQSEPVAGMQQPLPCLTNVAQIRSLSMEEAQQAYPVCIQGVVLHYDPKTCQDLVIQDATGGIYVMGADQQHYVLHPGQLVELRGVSSAGEYAPVVVQPTLKVLGEAPIPPARPVSFDQLASGSEDGQWVEISGVVRSVAVGKPGYSECLLVKLAVHGGQFTARVLDFDATATNWLVDAEARVRGVCIPIFNRKRQLLNVSLLVPGMLDLHVERAAPEQRFSQPLRSINSLLQFQQHNQWGHRVKVQGQVTLQKPGEYLFIKDQTDGVCVRTWQSTPVNLGDEVEVLGFPARGEYSPVLEDAIFRKVASKPVPTPVMLKAAQTLLEDHDADLIRVEAQLLQYIRRVNDVVLVLQDGGVMFHAYLDTPRNGNLPSLPPVGSRVRVTGICQEQLENQRWPQSFRMLLRSSADVFMVQAPAWWTLRRTLWALGAVSVLFSAILGVVVRHSKQKVREQVMARREAEAQFAAVNQERNRLAADLHDTLEQGLTGIALQLEAAHKAFATVPEIAQHHLAVAKTLVRQSQGEVRRSVWDLRSQMLDNNDLASALAAIGRQLSESVEVQVVVGTTGPTRRLPSIVENNLLRIGQEAITNALKYSCARNIDVQVVFRPETVLLSVRDDGQGFNFVSNPDAIPSGHFGLTDMRERAKRLKGSFSLQSTPGTGTEITVEVPAA
jgi:signal transduction histidine kinase